MATTRKTRSAAELFHGFGATLRHYFIGRPRAYFETAHRRLRNLPLTNFELGCSFAESGKWLDAVFRFKLALWLQPNFPQAWYNLGACYVRLNRRADARKAFLKTLAAVPNHADAIYMLSSIDPHAVPEAARPKRMSRDTVTNYFTRVAPFYEESERQKGYRAPQFLFDAVRPLLKGPGVHLLDVGCGTGLACYPWRVAAAEITGIDFTPAMLDRARAAKVGDRLLYEQLLREDIILLPDNALAAASFDVALCCNVAQFLGDLYPPLLKIKRLLKPGGLLALTYEPFGTQTGFAVNADSGRFGHHPDYVKRMATHVGFELRKELKASLYTDTNAALVIFAAKETA